MNVILERTVCRFYYQFSTHSYAKLGLHKYHLMLMVYSLVRSYSFLDGLKEYTEFYVCEKTVSIKYLIGRLIFSERENKLTFCFLCLRRTLMSLHSSSSLSQEGDDICATCSRVGKQYRRVAAFCYSSDVKHQFSGINYKFRENRIS